MKTTPRLGIALLTIVRREVTRILRIWQQSLLPPLITLSLYFVIFGHIIGPRIGPMEGIHYAQYIAPGLIMMAIINNAYANVCTSFYGVRFERNIEELLVAPVPYSIILLGYVSGGVIRALFVGVEAIVITLLFVHFSIQHIVLTFITMILASVFFALAGFTNALFAKRFDDIAFIPTFVLTPLTYLGGIFYSVTMLPPMWQKVAHLNPILYLTNSFRFAMLGTSNISIYLAFAITGMAIALLTVLNLYLLKKRRRY